MKFRKMRFTADFKYLLHGVIFADVGLTSAKMNPCNNLTYFCWSQVTWSSLVLVLTKFRRPEADTGSTLKSRNGVSFHEKEVTFT